MTANNHKIGNIGRLNWLQWQKRKGGKEDMFIKMIRQQNVLQKKLTAQEESNK